MTPDAFRRFALAVPGATEGIHGSHPDFRLDNRVFATLGYPDAGWAMVKLAPPQQELLVTTMPEVFAPAKGAWGRRGSTLLRLDRADETAAVGALQMAVEAMRQKRR